MTPIPRVALFLGLFGLVPFFWGALTARGPALPGWGRNAAGPRVGWGGGPCGSQGRRLGMEHLQGPEPGDRNRHRG